VTLGILSELLLKARSPIHTKFGHSTDWSPSNRVVNCWKRVIVWRWVVGHTQRIGHSTDSSPSNRVYSVNDYWNKRVTVWRWGLGTVLYSVNYWKRFHQYTTNLGIQLIQARQTVYTQWIIIESASRSPIHTKFEHWYRFNWFKPVKPCILSELLLKARHSLALEFGWVALYWDQMKITCTKYPTLK
jgi:hypothetical protein